MFWIINEESVWIKPLISIIVPVYNEEDTIGEVISRLISLKKIMSMEIIVIDDGSNDNTTKIIKKYSEITHIRHKTNLGKGTAIRNGIYKSTGDIIVVQDADLEYSPEEIPKLVEPILNGKADLVFGSRFLGNIDGMSFPHFIGNKILSLFSQLLYGCAITDVMTGHKAIKRSILNNIDITKNGFEVEIEIMSKLIKNGYKLIEVPIIYKYRTTGESKIKYWDGINCLITLFKARFLK